MLSEYKQLAISKWSNNTADNGKQILSTARKQVTFVNMSDMSEHIIVVNLSYYKLTDTVETR